MWSASAGCVFLGLSVIGLLQSFHYAVAAAATSNEGIQNKILNDPDLSQFLIMLGRSSIANVTLQYRQVTIFAPTNEAFQNMDVPVQRLDQDLVLYHMTNVPKKTTELGSSYTSLNSEMDGNPPLWITKISGKYHDELFVNNAQVLVRSSDIAGTQQNNIHQILHKIDEVLMPTKSPKTAQTPLYNPTALEFLESYESLIIDPHRLRSFRQKVQENNKQHVFKSEGGNTFFIPIDEGFKNKQIGVFDGKIIDGHVIPNHVLFTKPTKKDVPFETLANGDSNVRVVVSFTQEFIGAVQTKYYVKSHTLLSDGKHSQGVVLSEIVKANIPVKNGVVHLIQKPLMVVDNNVKELLEEKMAYICGIGAESVMDRGDEFLKDHGLEVEKDGGILSNFIRAINDAEFSEFSNLLSRSHDITLFAPCNAAWNDDFALNNIIRDKARFKEILKLHLVLDTRLYVDRIIRNSENKVRTYDPRNNLYFNVMQSGINRTVTVEGGGVNATIIQPDLAATNGVIHIIDRVLGIPYSTVYNKLETDPTLNFTYQLARQSGFLREMNDTNRKFTFFAPRNFAWEEAKIDHPSAVKRLFLPENIAYHAQSLLGRHLVISDEAYTMERIKQLSMVKANNVQFGGYSSTERRTVELPTLRDKLEISVEEGPDHTFMIYWKGEKIPVHRPNVGCTNGIIHVIDVPFLVDGDIRVNSASAFKLTPIAVMLLAGLAFLIN